MAAMTEPETSSGPAVIHNVGLATIKVAGQSIPSGGRLDVDDVAELGELPVDAYVQAKAPAAGDEAAPATGGRRRSSSSAPAEPTPDTPAQPAEPDAGTGDEEPRP